MEFGPPMPSWEILENGGIASSFQAFRGPPEVRHKLVIQDNFLSSKAFHEAL